MQRRSLAWLQCCVSANPLAVITVPRCADANSRRSRLKGVYRSLCYRQDSSVRLTLFQNQKLKANSRTLCYGGRLTPVRAQPLCTDPRVTGKTERHRQAGLMFRRKHVSMRVNAVPSQIPIRVGVPGIQAQTAGPPWRPRLTLTMMFNMAPG